MDCILLTSVFPYSNGETFLETEIKYFNVFTNVYIIPSIKTIGMHRQIPENCVIIDSYCNGFFFNLFEIVRNINILFREFIKLKRKSILNFITIKRAIAYYFYGCKNCCAIKKIIAKNKIKNPIIYSYWADFKALAISIISNNFFCITRIHRIDVFEERHPNLYIPFREQILSHLSKIYSISVAGSEYIKLKYRKTLNLDILNVSKLGTTNTHGINPWVRNNSITVVSCSNIIEVKRVNLIAEFLFKSTLKVNWVHFGDGKLFDELNSYVNDHIVSNINVFLAGFKKRNEIFDYYKNNSIDLFINVSESEGIPVSIMEAISFGIPIVATNVGGTSEIVCLKNGWLIDSDNVINGLQHAFSEYINMSSQEIMEKRKWSRKIWEKEYNADKNYNAFLHNIIKAANLYYKKVIK